MNLKLVDEQEHYLKVFDAYITFFRRCDIAGAIVADDGRFVEVNRKFCEMVGYPESWLLSHGWPDITVEEDLAIDQENVNRVLSDDINEFVLHKRYKTRLGKIIPVKIHAIGNRRADFGMFTVYIVELEGGE